MRGHGFIRDGLDLNYFVAKDAEEVVPMLRREAAGREPAPEAEEFIKERF